MKSQTSKHRESFHAPEPVPSYRHHTELIVLLGGLTALGPLCIDMYLPALPTIAETLSTDSGHVQLSLASYFAGLAMGQAFYGPLADRFGRKIPLYVGLVLFILASVGCSLAGSIETLIALRFVQALGSCAGPVISRAIVRDLFGPREAIRVFSLLVLVMGISPVLAPLLGGQILALSHWNAIFQALAVLGVIALIATVWRLAETHRLDAVRPSSVSGVLRVYWGLLRDRTFMGYTLTGAAALAGMFSYIAGSPFVFIELFNIPASRFGAFFGVNALGFVIAAQVNVRLVRRFDSAKVIQGVLWVQTAAGVLLLGGTVAGVLGLYGTAALLFIYVALIGCMVPNTTALAMASQGAIAGSASALIGTLQFGLGAVASSAVGATNRGGAIPMAAGVSICGFAALMIYRSLVYREVQDRIGRGNE